MQRRAAGTSSCRQASGTRMVAQGCRRCSADLRITAGRADCHTAPATETPAGPPASPARVCSPAASETHSCRHLAAGWPYASSPAAHHRMTPLRTRHYSQAAGTPTSMPLRQDGLPLPPCQRARHAALQRCARPARIQSAAALRWCAYLPREPDHSSGSRSRCLSGPRG